MRINKNGDILKNSINSDLKQFEKTGNVKDFNLTTAMVIGCTVSQMGEVLMLKMALDIEYFIELWFSTSKKVYEFHQKISTFGPQPSLHISMDGNYILTSNQILMR